MKLREYLFDKKWLIFFYIMQMSFVCAVSWFDRKNRLLDANITYILVVSTIFFAVYLGIDFTGKRSYCKALKAMLRDKGGWHTARLPQPRTVEQKIFNEVLTSLDDEANRYIEAAAEKAREDLEFITTWVHEIKTPIAVSRLVIENSLNGGSTEKSLESIGEEIDKIESHVQRALYYTRLNDFTKDYLIGNADMQKLVKESIKRSSKGFIGKGIRLELDSLGYEVSTDAKWMGFILDQILANCIKYTPQGGCVSIAMEAGDKEKLLHIRDNGVGIKQEDVARVFQKSFTGSNGRANQSSTGMGLYLAQKMARKLGHFITVSSKYKEGTTVTIHFPKWTDYFDVTKM